jgi:hypothetical protein
MRFVDENDWHLRETLFSWFFEMLDLWNDIVYKCSPVFLKETGLKITPETYRDNIFFIPWLMPNKDFKPLKFYKKLFLPKFLRTAVLNKFRSLSKALDLKGKKLKFKTRFDSIQIAVDSVKIDKNSKTAVFRYARKYKFFFTDDIPDGSKLNSCVFQKDKDKIILKACFHVPGEN